MGVALFSKGLGLLGEMVSVLSDGVALFQRDLIYHPIAMMDSPAQCGVPEMRVVRIQTVDGLTLTAWHAPARQSYPTLVLFHGNAANLSYRAPKARALLDRGIGVLLVGYRGYGGNPGRPSEQGFYLDARAHMDWLADQGVGWNSMILMGESLGNGVAIHMAQDLMGLAGLVLESPFLSLPELAPPSPMVGLADMLMVDKFDNAEKIAKARCPILIIQGERDGIVPASHARRLMQLAGRPVEAVFYSAGGHNDLWGMGADQVVCRFVLAQGCP